MFQTGSQQRSQGPFRQAVELIRNGKIGKVQRVDTYIGNIDAGKWQAPVTPPPGVYLELLAGPAPYADYFPNRCHYGSVPLVQRLQRRQDDLLGADHNDITQWWGPTKIRAAGEGALRTGEFGPDGRTLPRKFQVAYT